MVRICFIVPVPAKCQGITIPKIKCGGIATWTMNVFHNLDDTDFKYCYVDISAKSRKNIDDKTTKIFSKIKELIFIMEDMKYKIKEFKPDIIHITTSGSLGFIRDYLMVKYIKKRNIKTILHVRFGRLGDIVKSKKGFEYCFFKKIYKLIDKIIVIDENTYKQTFNEDVNKKIVYIPNFTIDYYKKINFSKSNINRDIIYTGWIIKSKGIEELINAWNLIKDKYDWTLRLVGPASEDYINYLKSNYNMNKIIFEGECDHDKTIELINASKILILPSYTEGFPNSIVEAMSLKKAIIGTSVGAIPEMLNDDCGIIIPPKNVDSIVKSLELLINNNELINNFGELAYIKYKKKYSVEIIIKQYSTLWNSITKSN